MVNCRYKRQFASLLTEICRSACKVGGLADSDDSYVLRKFKGHDCFHIFPDSPNFNGIDQNLLKVTSSSFAMLAGM